MRFCSPVVPHVYADLCLQQTKSEMQVEFFVSDSQEVRERFALWSHLDMAWPNVRETFSLAVHLPFTRIFVLSLSHVIILTPVSLFLFTQIYCCSTYSSFVGNRSHPCACFLGFSVPIFTECSSLTTNLWRRIGNGFTDMFPPSGGQRHSKHPDWRRERQCASLPRAALHRPHPRGEAHTNVCTV